MARKVRIYRDIEVQWPNSCAKCRKKEGLVSAQASIGRVTSVRPTLTGAIAVSGELMHMGYPVCAQHKKGLELANLLTRNTAGFKFLRGMVYFIGALSLPLLLLLLVSAVLRLAGAPESSSPGLPGAMIAIYIVFAFAFLQLISAYRKLPLRLVKQDDAAVTIRFSNNIYAAEFARLNRDKIFE